MGYSSDDSMVRVDFFKESGKWYTSEAIEMRDYRRPSIHGALKVALNEALYMPEPGHLRYAGMTAVCITPCHEHSHPILLTLPLKGKLILTEWDMAESDPTSDLSR